MGQALKRDRILKQAGITLKAKLGENWDVEANKPITAPYPEDLTDDERVVLEAERRQALTKRRSKLYQRPVKGRTPKKQVVAFTESEKVIKKMLIKRAAEEKIDMNDVLVGSRLFCAPPLDTKEKAVLAKMQREYLISGRAKPFGGV